MTSDSENYKNLRTFFNEEYHALRSYAKSRIDDAADRDAEDIVQEVALKIFSRSNSASPITNIA
ncbi:MAG TPA: RNA polymerase sigma factor, partial [Pricia sp.]|nr:RNA polymerase sigma factor [Pricia sp.]